MCPCALQDIKLFINSPGGSVTAGMGIYDAMQVCKLTLCAITSSAFASSVCCINKGPSYTRQQTSAAQQDVCFVPLAPNTLQHYALDGHGSSQPHNGCPDMSSESMCSLQMCRADVSTYCFGLAASMGAFLLTAGAKGKRFSMPNARIMIHQPLGGASGQAVDIEIQAREIMYHKANLNSIMAECTGQPIDQVSSLKHLFLHFS